MAELLDQIGEWIDAAHTVDADFSQPERRSCRQICTVNPEFVIDARNNAAFAQVLRQADLRVADGVGVVWAARLQGVVLPERITGSDGIYALCGRAAELGWRVFFLGAAPGVAQRAALRLGQLYPGLIIAGSYAGSPQARDWPLVQRRLSEAQPDLLFVAYGHPRQDFWIASHRSQLPASVAVGVGGAFDFVAGVTTRAPVYMRRLGLEWLHRLLRQPWRWRRMAKLPVFAMLSIRQAVHSRSNR